MNYMENRRKIGVILRENLIKKGIYMKFHGFFL
jgi:hypothetical protein